MSINSYKSVNFQLRTYDLTIISYNENLSPVLVKNKTFWTPAAHVKVTFSLFLERICKRYENFECFLPSVGYYLW